MDTLLAVPSANPGGLEAGMGMHFGHCEVFTLVEIEHGQVKNVTTLDNPPHAQGGCLAPVQLLADKGVKALLAGGMGFRPLMAFNQVGIHVFYAGQLPTVGEGVRAFLAGQLPEFSQEHTCRGGH
ncbi:MAG: dinitrogenase iron-molybdenum cofactor biosynthesis protein [Desulfovibrio desulfuricans]|jgi:predicted Fe-Mo cluster-binding NifX family protein|nr:dinitrogenase iron-molybdenum cofactor biosynthesis protein [Desulfovibrio desulfuricans]